MSDLAILEDVFDAALHKPPADRASYLNQTCASDPPLRRQIEKLLAAYEDAHSFLESPAVVLSGLPSTTGYRYAECHPAQVGPYKLLEQIGEGGMGVVYMAQQTRPVERRVALKIVKPGMDSRKVIGRFEAERQALAMMDHPHIARVLDAGLTESGHPYFAMELVNGIPITKYCDENLLGLRERLELFITVCEAIQHAHQKGIIHRDLKPSNVLVAECDERPIAKVIDFGIAKAMNQRLTEMTVFTEFGQVIGTLEYMSPEQAKLDQLDIDTRSDVYSLGVLMYELLTGTTPFQKHKLAGAPFDEVLRIIREEEPETVSTRIKKTRSSELGALSDRSAPHSALRAPRLSELDWIALKALDKDRTRRYETASALAADIRCYLADEPVQACPPSTAYCVQKFTQKNRTAIATATAVLFSLLLGTGISIWQAVRATVAEAQANSNEAKARWAEVQAVAAADAEREARLREAEQRRRAEQNFETALNAVDRMLVTISSEDLKDIPRIQPFRRQILQGAMDLYEEFNSQTGGSDALSFRAANTWRAMSELCRELGDYHVGKDTIERSVHILEELVGRDPVRTDYRESLANSQFEAAWLYVWALPDPEKAEQLFRVAHQNYVILAAQDPEQSFLRKRQFGSIQAIGKTLLHRGRIDEAITHLRTSIEAASYEKDLPAHMRAAIWRDLADAYAKANNPDADQAYRRAVAEFRKSPIDSKFDRDQYYKVLLSACKHLADREPAEVERYAREALMIARRLSVDYPSTPSPRAGHSYALQELAKLRVYHAGLPAIQNNPAAVRAAIEEARALYREAIDLHRQLVVDFPTRRYKLELARLLEDVCHLLLRDVDAAAIGSVGPAKAVADNRTVNEAKSMLEQAIRLTRQLRKEAPSDDDLARRLEKLLKTQSDCFGDQGEDSQSKTDMPLKSGGT